MRLEKYSKLKKIRSSIFIIVTMLISQMGFSNISFANSVPQDYDVWSDFNMMRYERHYINVESTKEIKIGNNWIDVDVEVSDVTIDNTNISSLEESAYGWYIIGEDEGTTTAKVYYSFTSTEQGVNINGNGCDTITISVYRYNCQLYLDSYSGVILPGESFQISGKLQESVKDANENQKFVDVDNAVININMDSTLSGGWTDCLSTPQRQNGENVWKITADSSYSGQIGPTYNFVGKIIALAGYSAKTKAYVNNQAVNVYQSKSSRPIQIFVADRFYEIHNRGDYDAGEFTTRELLQGPINAICTGDAAEFEIWEKYYDNGPQKKLISSTDLNDISIKSFYLFSKDDMPLRYLNDDSKYVVEDKHNQYEYPLEGRIFAQIEILNESISDIPVFFENSIPVNIKAYDMKFEGLTNENSVDVFLSSDALNAPTLEMKVRAYVDCAEKELSSNAYEMEYIVKCPCESNEWEYEEVFSGTLDSQGYVVLDYNTLSNLHEMSYFEDEEEGGHYSPLVEVRAREKKNDGTLGEGYYSYGDFYIIIYDDTDSEFLFESNRLFPGEKLHIPTSGEACFQNEFTDTDCKYFINDEPVVSSNYGNGWYTVEKFDDEWVIEINNYASSIGKDATVSFNYTIEGENIPRRHEFEFNVIGKQLYVDYSTNYDGCKMIFGSNLKLTPCAEYTYYDSNAKEIIHKQYPEDNIDGLTFSLERTGTSFEGSSPYGGYTKAERNGRDWDIISLSPNQFGQNKPDNGYDAYHLKATLGDLTDTSEVECYVTDEYYRIEHSDNKSLKINVQGNDKTIKLSDFALYRIYLKDNKTNNTWIGKELATNSNINSRYTKLYFEWFDEEYFSINNDEDTLTVKDGLNDFPLDTCISVESQNYEYWRNFKFTIVDEGTGGGNSGGGSPSGVIPSGSGDTEGSDKGELESIKNDAYNNVLKEAGDSSEYSVDIKRILTNFEKAIGKASSPSEIEKIKGIYIDSIKTAKAVNELKVSQNKSTSYKNGKIKISFKNLSFDKTKKIAKYEVYRKVKGGKYSKVKTINNNKKKTIAYTNSKNLKKNKKYYFKVRGLVKLADGSYAHSKWSKEQSVKCKKTRK